MATSTTNISNVSISVSGKSTKTATISWTKPTLPANVTITSCTLTGSASSFTTGNKGATLTIGSTSVSSGSSFTVNLGSDNSTTSVTASFVGQHKQSNTSVTLSNLVYTVNYTENYTVTFKDWDGTVLKTQSVASGGSATAPSNPSRTGYRFIGWDKTFANITSDLTITAQYEQIITYTVTFVDYDGTVLKIQNVEAGNSATAPTSPSRVGYTFTGWDKSFSNITSNLTVTAQYVIWYALNIKESGSWVDIGKVFRKINGIWVEETNENWVNLFNTNTDYRRKEIPYNPTAILYEDGTFIFSNVSDVDSSHGDVIATYTGWDTITYNTSSQIPWYNNKDLIEAVVFNNINVQSSRNWFYSCNNLKTVNGDGIYTTDMFLMFYDCQNLTSIDTNCFDTRDVTSMYFTFGSCSALSTLNLSNFNTSNVTDMSFMFYGCESLTSLNVSNFDTRNVTTMKQMFWQCLSLTSLDLTSFDMSNANLAGILGNPGDNHRTVYVKDEISKNLLESSSGYFPSTTTVIIGSPT